MNINLDEKLEEENVPSDTKHPTELSDFEFINLMLKWLKEEGVECD